MQYPSHSFSRVKRTRETVVSEPRARGELLASNEGKARLLYFKLAS